MQCEHSMFLNCVPATHEDLGQDVLAKIHSSVCNTLFKSAKFYPKPSHADKVVGICLYDCNFWLPGMQGDFAWAKSSWNVLCNEIIIQTGIVRQQVIMRWHPISRGMYKFAFQYFPLLFAIITHQHKLLLHMKATMKRSILTLISSELSWSDDNGTICMNNYIFKIQHCNHYRICQYFNTI